MPHNLARDFLAAMISNDDRPVIDKISARGASAKDRLSVYRNNIFSNLTEILASSFPGVQALVGVEFFRFAASQFIRAHLPVAAALMHYGDEFPNFLAQMAEAASLPYLPDLARLEWSLNEAYHAPSQPPLSPEQLQAAAEGRADDAITLRASSKLFASDYPVEAIWLFAKSAGQGQAPSLDLAGNHLLLYRKQWQVARHALSRAEYVFLSALAMRQGLEQSISMAQAEDTQFDPARFLQFLLREEILSISNPKGAQ